MYICERLRIFYILSVCLCIKLYCYAEKRILWRTITYIHVLKCTVSFDVGTDHLDSLTNLGWRKMSVPHCKIDAAVAKHLTR